MIKEGVISHDRSTPKDHFPYFVEWFNQLFYNVLNIRVSVICMHFKRSLTSGSSGGLCEELLFQHNLQHYSRITRTTEIQLCLGARQKVCCNVTNCYQKIASMNRKLCFDQLATTLLPVIFFFLSEISVDQECLKSC